MNIDFNPVNATVTIAKEEVNPVSLILTQEYGEHHHFEITLDYDMYGDDFMSNPIKHIELIGRLVFISFNNREGSSSDRYFFKGVVTGVKQSGKEGKKGYLVVTGSSPTIMLEKGNRMDIYSNRSLYQISSKVAERAYEDYLKFVSEPIYKNKIDFLMQYNESDWDFLKRLAYLYRENFFYDGYELKFGTCQDAKTVDLTYDREILDLEFCSKMLATNFERYQYVAESDTTIKRDVPNKVDNSNDYLDKAEEMNHIAMTFLEHPRTYMDTPVYGNSEMTEMLKREKSRNAAQTITIKGKSKTHKTSIGQIINISLPENLSNTSNIGTYRVTKSIHKIDEKNRYSCEFEAIPASLDTIPTDKPKTQYADSILAMVKSNEDPLNQGRVQIEFEFSNNYNYAWVRVLTPNAGSSELINQNRGMVFIPEKGDQVMIGFEYGDPNRPYVMGSLFHGKNGKGGGQNNAEKSIITRSGIKIVFNDNQKSLHIEDPSGNTWDMDGQGNINVFAPKDIILKASNTIRMEAGKDVNVTAANEFTLDALRKILMNTPELRQMIASSWFLHSINSTVLNDNDLKLESSNTYLSGSNKLFMHSDKLATLNSLGITNIKGKEKNNFTNSTDSYEVVTLEIPAKILVHFRPKADWRGEGYGFDWMRIGDTNMFNDQWYGNIVSYQYTDDTYTTLETNPNQFRGKFKTDITMYNQLKTQYKVHTIPWLNKKDASGNDLIDASGNTTPEEYFVSWLSLYPGREAELSLVLNVFEEADEIHFISDQTVLQVEPQAIDLKASGISVGKADLPDSIKVKCIGEFSDDQVIEAKVIKRDAAGQIISNITGGKLKVWRNHSTKRKKRKVVFVKVQTPANSSGVTNSTIENEKKRINQYLNQALIELSSDSVKINLNLNITDTATPKEFTSFIDSATAKIKQANSSGVKLNNYLKQQLTAQEGTTYDSFFKCFYLKEEGWNSDPTLSTAGFSSLGADFVVVFDSKTDQTAAHEFLHSLNLPHSFTNKPTASSDQFTYEYKQTENLLDYTHHDFIHKNDRYALWYWQWKIANDTAT